MPSRTKAKIQPRAKVKPVRNPSVIVRTVLVTRFISGVLSMLRKVEVGRNCREYGAVPVCGLIPLGFIHFNGRRRALAIEKCRQAGIPQRVQSLRCDSLPNVR